MLICPSCRGVLEWEIKEELGDEIETARIKCASCAAIYTVRHGIACFLLDSDPSSTVINNEFVVAEQAKTEYADNTISVIDKCARIMDENLSDIVPGSVILDFAAGHGNLFSMLNKRENVVYLVNDIDYDSLVFISRLNAENERLNINYLAFDMLRSPLKDGSVSCAVSLLGLQHISDYDKCIKELKRVVKGSVFHISSFCDEADKVNLFALRIKKICDMWLLRNFAKIMLNHHITYDILYRNAVEALGIDPSDDQVYIGQDRFPLVDTMLDFVLARLSQHQKWSD
jgi:ubiquinone/menaquinone biosynthesis C-methylase UbiE/uncharacterized protein YbaR (Trm112 family)